MKNPCKLLKIEKRYEKIMLELIKAKIPNIQEKPRSENTQIDIQISCFRICFRDILDLSVDFLNATDVTIFVYKIIFAIITTHRCGKNPYANPVGEIQHIFVPDVISLL